MEWINVELRIPKEMKQYVEVKDGHAEFLRNALLLFPAIKKCKISYGKAAEILGISKFELITLYGEIGLPYFDMTVEEVEADLETYQRVKETERILENVKATMAMENMTLTQEEQSRIKDCLEGKKSFDKAVEDILKRYDNVIPDIVSNVVYEFAAQLRRILRNNLSKIILYGSYARGDFHADSDIDIMVLVKLLPEEIEKIEESIFDIAFDIELEYGIHISPIIKNEEQFKYWVDVLPFYRNVKNEGIEIDDMRTI